MNIVTIRQFATLCDCSYEAIRQRVENGSIETITQNPTIIDADKYSDTIQLIKLRVSNLAQKQATT